MIDTISPILDHSLTRRHNATGKIVIGPLPVSFSQSDSPPSETINALITSYRPPDIQLNYEKEYHYKARVHIPITEDNEYLNETITINMIADSRNENWWALYRYMQTVQSGKTNGYPIQNKKDFVYGNDGFYRNRLMYIPYIDIIDGDNTYQIYQTTRYYRCFPQGLTTPEESFIDPSIKTFALSCIFSFRNVFRSDSPQHYPTPPASIVDTTAGKT